MIINAIVDLATTLVNDLIGLLPAGSTLPWDLTAGFGVMMSFDQWLPIHETFVGVGMLMTIALASFVWGTFRVILKFIPLIGIG